MYGLTTGIKGFTISTVKQIAMSAMTAKLRGVPDEYQVLISTGDAGSALTPVIYGALQEPVRIKTGSRWEPYIDGVPMGGLVQAAEIGSQILTGVSLQNAVTTRRMWRGSDPIEIRMKLAFFEEANCRTEILNQIVELQALALPEIIGWGQMRPPGPNPVREFSKQGQNISIKMGTICEFSEVIISEVEVTLDTRLSGSKGTKGLPIAAVADITFQTYQTLGKKQLKEAYGIKDTDEGVVAKEKPKTKYALDSAFM